MVPLTAVRPASRHWQALASRRHLDFSGTLHPGRRGKRARSFRSAPGFEEACRNAAVRWRQMGNDLTVAVNVSPVQAARDDLIERVSRVLGETGLPPYAPNSRSPSRC